MSKWYESDNPGTVVRGGGWRLGVIVVVAVLFVMALGALVWGIQVATSPAKGAGDAFQTKNSGTNRIAAQERFEDLYQEILASDKRIDVAADAYKRNKSGSNEVNLTGAITYCQSVVADYNAEARKYTSEQFRAADLPASINESNESTDCKETVR